jgi:hypothetical protein
MELVASYKHVGDVVGNRSLHEAKVYELFANLLDLVEAGFGRVVAQVVFNVLVN